MPVADNCLHLIYIRDVAIDRIRRHELRLAGLGLDLVAIEL